MGLGGSKSLFADIDIDFDLGRVLGKGSFGKVFCLSRKDTGKLYALKLLNKRELIDKNMVDKTIKERDLLSELKHPFLVNLRYAFQTKKELCMVIDLMTGGDLGYHLERDRKGFSEERVKFYATNIILALEFLHEHNVVHRDIKPENTLLDGNGYCHLTDFNVSHKLSPGEEQAPGTAGTINYMAPEIILDKVFTKQVDVWSLGATLYEMACGRLPVTEGKTTEERKAAITKCKISWSSGLPIDLKHLLEKILVPKEERIKLPEVKKDPFFDGVDWDAIASMTAKAPYIPPTDRANVDSRFDLEDQFQAKKKYKSLSESEQELFSSWNYRQPDDVDQGGVEDLT